MATFTTTDNNKKRDIVKIKAKEAFYKSVSGMMGKTNSSTIESNNTKFNNNNIISRGYVPESHKMAADSFMIIKKIFGNPVVQCKPTKEEMNFLARYDFNPIEFSTYKQIEEELSLLKKWSYSKNNEIQRASDKIISIRSKELKYLIAINYITVTNDIYNGHKALEKYLENISKYRL